MPMPVTARAANLSENVAAIHTLFTQGFVALRLAPAYSAGGLRRQYVFNNLMLPLPEIRAAE